jgi:RNA polymerase sigma factor (sigma-70 family)
VAVNATDDSAVIREVLSGRTDAFRALVERYFATVRLVALAKTGNLADAEDVAQETFIKAYETLGVLRNRERLAPWLVAIARNIAISLVRRRERERRNAEAYPIDPLVHPDHERRETLDAVARQVEALPENLREVVLLHYFEGLKCREIGERLDLNTNAVVKRLTRGRELLGDRLLREWGEGARPETAKPGVSRVMGAIAVLPRPDWKAQLASMGGAGTALKAGGLAAALLGPPLAFKVFTAVAAVALGVLYVSLNVRGGGDKSPTASAGTSAPVEEKSLIAAATSGVGEALKSTFTDEEDGPVWVAIESVAPVPMEEVGFVSGVVVETDGTPVRDAIVWAGGDQNNGKATSNPNGEFRINVSAPVPKIEAGEVSKHVSLTCSMPGFVPRVVSGVRLGTSDVQVVLARPAILAGQIVDLETGTAISEFRVSSEGPHRNPDTGEYLNPVTQEFISLNGEFRLEFPYGLDKLHVMASGYTRQLLEIGLEREASREDLVIEMERGRVIRGVVLDGTTSEPVSPAWIGAKVEGWEGPFFSGAGTDQQGAFVIDGLPRDQTVTLIVDANGYMREVMRDVTPDSDEVLQISVGRGGTLRGRVIYQGGSPPGIDKARIEEGYCRVEVTQYSEDFPLQRQEYVRSDGTYEVTGLRTGLYRAQAYYWPPENYYKGYSVNKLVYVREGEVAVLDVNYDERASHIRVAMEGESAQDAIVELCVAAEPGNVLESRIPHPWQSPDLLRSHDFIHLESGDYVVRVYHPEHKDRAMEQTIKAVAGEKAEVYFDFGEGGDADAALETGDAGTVGTSDDSGEPAGVP